MNIFLAPATLENANRTLTNSVDIELAEKFLSHSDYESLRRTLSGKTTFNCWAMTEDRTGQYQI